MKQVFAILAFMWILTLNSQSINNFFDLGMENLNKKQYQAAIAEFDKVCAKDPFYQEAFYGRALAYFGLADYNKVVEDCSAAIKAKNDYFEAYILKSDANLKLNKKKEALKDLESIVTIKPTYTAAWEKMGSLYYGEKNFSKARETIDKAIGLNSKLSETYFLSGEMYFMEEKFDLAKDHYKKASEFDKTNASAFYQYALCCNKTDDFTGAEKALGSAITLGNNENAVLLRAEVRLKLKNYQGSVDDFAAYIIKTKTKDPEVYHNKGLAYSNLNKHDLAIKEYSKAIMYNREFFKSYYERAVSYSSMGAAKETMAMRDFTKALEINPNCGEAYHKRGKFYFEKGKFSEAIDDFTKALKNIQDAEIYYLRGASFHALDNTKKACEDLKKAADLGHQKAAEDKLRICH
ncbi:MAG: tetratricopeptide repeat protein [Bacteroidales bacterium]|nr:tetratricopeptide repeat protein [Bacteroidales bacterium]